jgi:hypothetical protein
MQEENCWFLRDMSERSQLIDESAARRCSSKVSARELRRPPGHSPARSLCVDDATPLLQSARLGKKIARRELWVNGYLYFSKRLAVEPTEKKPTGVRIFF